MGRSTRLRIDFATQPDVAASWARSRRRAGAPQKQRGVDYRATAFGAKHPMVGSFAGCCASAAKGHAAAPAVSVRNSRRFSRSNCIRSPPSQGRIAGSRIGEEQLAADPPTIFQDRENVRPDGLRATGSTNARPCWWGGRPLCAATETLRVQWSDLSLSRINLPISCANFLPAFLCVASSLPAKRVANSCLTAS